MPFTKEHARAEIIALVANFRANEPSLADVPEAQIEANYVRRLFHYLNWNTENTGLSVAEWEFVLQRTDEKGKRPDYLLQLDGQQLLVIDAKKVKYDMHDPRWMMQVYAYAYSTQNYPSSSKIDFALLTDFQEFVLLDCTLYAADPKAVCNFRILDWTCDDYVSEFDTLWELFEREQVRATVRSRGTAGPTGLWARYLSPKKVKANRIPPDKAFLSAMDDEKTGWRVRLAKDMKKRNPEADGALITAAVQLLIDRLIFVKVLSDREIEADYLTQLAEQVEQSGLAAADAGWFNACRDIFAKLNQFYNGSIFEPRPELEAVTVSNKVVRDVIRDLQPENSPYNFAVLPVEILGTIYERFLGRVVRATDQRVKIEDKPEVRKAGGVYYTPQYIVDYIVQHTVGELLAACKTPADVAKLKILDPACGSGSFLLGAYAALIKWHAAYYGDKEQLTKRDREAVYHDSDGRVRLTAKLKREILIQNIFGVDIDPQAVEVTRFSLSLKALEDTRRDELYEEVSLFKQTVLPDLRHNIKCGNSLVGLDYFSGQMFTNQEELLRVKPFGWEREFVGAFHRPARQLWFVTFVTHNSRVSERMVTYGVKTGDPLVFSAEDQVFIAEKIFETCRNEQIALVAANILPDHVHLVIAAEDEQTLTEHLRKIKGASSFAFQRARGWEKGSNQHVWAQKFNRVPIADSTALTNIVNYVTDNHLKHAERWGAALLTTWDKGLKPLVQAACVSVEEACQPAGGFDAVIGNPPYIRIQTLQETNPAQVPYLKGRYRAASSGNYDIYVVFVERGLSLLNARGQLGFILPHKFFNAKYGEPLRRLIAEGHHLGHVVHFGDQQVFDGATTYTALMFLDKAGNKQFEVLKVSHLDEWRGKGLAQTDTGPQDQDTGLQDKGLQDKGPQDKGPQDKGPQDKGPQDKGPQDKGPQDKGPQDKGLKPLVSVSQPPVSAGTILASAVTAAEWNFAVGNDAALLERLSRMPVRLGDVADRIFQGLVTGADPVFILEDRARGPYYSEATEQEHKIERELMHPLCKGSVNLRRYYVTNLTKSILFPYKLVDGKAELLTTKELSSKYPHAWEYLKTNKASLEARERGKWKHERWYAFGRSQNLSEMEQSKILTPSIASRASFSFDSTNFYYFVGSGGGGGGGYGITLKPEEQMAYQYILGLLNSKLLDTFLKSFSSPFSGGYYAYNRQYIEHLPIRRINFSDPADKARHDLMVQFVDSMLVLHKHKTAAHTQAEHEQLQRQIEATDRQIDALVYELYGLTPEEIAIVEGTG